MWKWAWEQGKGSLEQEWKTWKRRVYTTIIFEKSGNEGVQKQHQGERLFTVNRSTVMNEFNEKMAGFRKENGHPFLGKLRDKCVFRCGYMCMKKGILLKLKSLLQMNYFYFQKPIYKFFKNIKGKKK